MQYAWDFSTSSIPSRQKNPRTRSALPGNSGQKWWSSCVPAAAIGLPLNDFIEEHLGSPFVIAATLIFYGIIFIVLELHREKVAAAVKVEVPRGKHMSPDAEHSLRPPLPTTWPAYKTLTTWTGRPRLELAFSRYLQLFQVLQDLVQPSWAV